MQARAARDAEAQGRAEAGAGRSRWLSSITTSESPGNPARRSLSSPSTVAGSAVASRRKPQGTRRDDHLGRLLLAARTSSSVGLEQVDLLGDDAGLLAILVVDPAAHEDDRVGARAPPRGRPAPCRTRSTSIAASRSSSVANIIGSPFLVRIRLAAVIIPPTVTQSPSRRSASSTSAAVDLGAQRRADLLERVRGDEQADRLLLGGQQLGAIELLGGDRRMAGARRTPARPAPSAGVGAEVEDRALADERVLLGLLARPLGLLEHREHALARVAGRAEGAALDQRLDRLLVDRAVVDAGAEVPQVAERAPLLAGALDRLDGLDSPRP